MFQSECQLGEIEVHRDFAPDCPHDVRPPHVRFSREQTLVASPPSSLLRHQPRSRNANKNRAPSDKISQFEI